MCPRPRLLSLPHLSLLLRHHHKLLLLLSMLCRPPRPPTAQAPAWLVGKWMWLAPRLKEVDETYRGSARKPCTGDHTNPCACGCIRLPPPKWTNIFVDPPDPLMNPCPQPEEFHSHRVHFWVPELLYY